MYQNLQNRIIYFLNNNGGRGGEEGGGWFRGGKALKCHSTQTRITTKASESKHTHGIHQHPLQLCRTEQTVVKPSVGARNRALESSLFQIFHLHKQQFSLLPNGWIDSLLLHMNLDYLARLHRCKKCKEKKC